MEKIINQRISQLRAELSQLKAFPKERRDEKKIKAIQNVIQNLTSWKKK